MVHGPPRQGCTPALSDADRPLRCRLSRAEGHIRRPPARPRPHLPGRCTYRHGRSSLRSAAATGPHQLARRRSDRPGGATTRHLLQNILLIERDCGIGRTTLQAALTHGGYVWAVHGFLPTPSATWTGLAGRLATKFATVAPTLTSSQAAAVGQLLRSADRRALRAIAALTIPVGATTLGKHLPMGESWDGELDLSDEPSALMYLRRIGLIP